MSSFLCFLCRNTINSDTNEETREKYREVVGMNLCPDSHLCYICCHMLNKLWLFKSVCLKRSLEYPVLFSEKGTLTLQRNDTEITIVCSEETCLPNRSTQLYVDGGEQSINSNDYTKLEDDCNEFDDYSPENTTNTINIKVEIENIDERQKFEKHDKTFENFEKCEQKFEKNDEKYRRFT